MSWSLIQHDQILWKLDNSSHAAPHSHQFLQCFKIKFYLALISPSVLQKGFPQTGFGSVICAGVGLM